jgi:hypothetical protein
MRFQISSAWIVIPEKVCAMVKQETAMVFCAAYLQKKHSRRTIASANSKNIFEEKKVANCGDLYLDGGLPRMKIPEGNVTIYSSCKAIVTHNVEMIIFPLTITFYPYILKW